MKLELGRWWAAAAVVVALAACGGDDGGGDSTSASATLGADGGSTATASGVKVVVPPGAMAETTTLRIAEASTDAPALPGWVKAAGNTVEITPHGAQFSEPVTVRLPKPAVTLAANQRLYIAKADPGGSWEVLGDTVQNGEQLEVQVSSFSYFVPVVVTYLDPPLATVLPLPFAFGDVQLSCNGQPCAATELLRGMTVTATVSGNGGQLPAGCVDPRVRFSSSPKGSAFGAFDPPPGAALAGQAGGVFRANLVLDSLLQRQLAGDTYRLYVIAMLQCRDATTNALSLTWGTSGSLKFVDAPHSASTPRVVSFPAAMQFADGESPTVRGVLVGGASTRLGNGQPTATDRAEVYLERQAPGSALWQILSTHLEHQATVKNTTAGWWGFDFLLGRLSLADNGASFRLRACYRQPSTGTTSCQIGPVAPLTVVQHVVLPVFTQQPRSLAIRSGETASLTAVVAGTPAPGLQWQRRAPGGSADWAPVADGSGGDTASYTSPVLGVADSGVQYRLLASNAGGAVPSEVVTVTVSDAAVAPEIVAAPTALRVVQGSEAVFAVTASGTGPLSYQWFRDGAPLLGANGSQLKIAAAAAADKGDYAVRVSNAVGTRTSAAVALTVEAAPDAVPPAAPTLVTQPAAVAVTEGNTATFGVGVAGSGPFSFQWRRNGVALAGATAATHTIPGVTAADAGNYSVVVTNAVGSVTSQAATLGVAPALAPPAPAAEAPAINAQPGSVVVVPGMGAVLAVGTQGSGPLAYQWARNGTPLAGQTGAMLVVAAATGQDAGSYQVTVSNAAGSVTSQAAQLIVLGAPAITAGPVPASAVEGATATFGVTATGTALRYQWMRNGDAIPGATAASYTTPALVLADSGAVYGVVVYNGADAVIAQGGLLTVTAAPPAGTAQGKIAAGPHHTCAVLRDGTAACWGVGSHGELGDGSAEDRGAPTPVAGLADVTTVAAGGTSSCAIHGEQRRLSCWGSINDAVGPTAAPGPAVPVRGVAVGTGHVCLIDATDGRDTVACWGSNTHGQLGDGSTTDRAQPVTVRRADGSALAGAVAVAAGVRHSCAQLADGSVWCWGGNIFFEAGLAAQRVPRRLPDQEVQVATDFTVGGRIRSGPNHTCGTDSSDGRVLCWGFNANGQLGDNTTNSRNDAQAVAPFGTLQVLVGTHHTCALRASDVLCWGQAFMGNGGEQEQLLMAQAAGRVAAFTGSADPAVVGAAGERHTCLLRASGDIVCWGANASGQIGNGAPGVDAMQPVSTAAGAVFWRP